MAFTFISHGSEHLEISSDDNHRFRFGIVRDGRGKSALVCKAHWKNGAEIKTNAPVSPDAARFASVCAKDFGLM